MTLVDTSVWVDFFRGRPVARPLVPLLETGEVLLHPWVYGELSLGTLGRQRSALLGDLRLLPSGQILDENEALAFIESQSLSGKGIGWVDANLLGSCLRAEATLWTHDRALHRLATSLKIAFKP